VLFAEFRGFPLAEGEIQAPCHATAGSKKTPGRNHLPKRNNYIGGNIFIKLLIGNYPDKGIIGYILSKYSTT
jgi:hypothetical protein